MHRLKALAGKIELPLLAAVMIVAGGLWGFSEMAEVARDTQPHAMDTAVLLAFREAGNPADPIGPRWVEEAVRDLTSLGSMSVLVFLVLSAAGYLALGRRVAAALFVLAAVGGGQVLSSLLKLGIERPRPELVPHMAQVFTPSFPSGHAMLSAVTYLTLGALAARVARGQATKIYLMSIALLASFVVGASRVYLGVHWPSDVLAGWCIGAAWAMAWWLAAEWFLRRRNGTGPDD